MHNRTNPTVRGTVVTTTGNGGMRITRPGDLSFPKGLSTVKAADEPAKRRSIAENFDMMERKERWFVVDQRDDADRAIVPFHPETGQPLADWNDPAGRMYLEDALVAAGPERLGTVLIAYCTAHGDRTAINLHRYAIPSIVNPGDVGLIVFRIA
jgi:hypothetical protein